MEAIIHTENMVCSSVTQISAGDGTRIGETSSKPPIISCQCVFFLSLDKFRSLNGG